MFYLFQASIELIYLIIFYNPFPNTGNGLTRQYAGTFPIPDGFYTPFIEGCGQTDD